jgi:hypothetical protein
LAGALKYGSLGSVAPAEGSVQGATPGAEESADGSDESEKNAAA